MQTFIQKYIENWKIFTKTDNHHSQNVLVCKRKKKDTQINSMSLLNNNNVSKLFYKVKRSVEKCTKDTN